MFQLMAMTKILDTIEKPFKTIRYAQQQVRKIIQNGLVCDISVWLREGTYFIEEPLEFDKRDSGTKEHSVTYTGYPGETVTVNGGKEITCWQKTDNDIWVTKVPEVKSGDRRLSTVNCRW